MNKKETIIFDLTDSNVLFHNSKRMRFYRIFDLVTQRPILLECKQGMMVTLRERTGTIEIYKCALFHKAPPESSIFGGMDVYFKMSIPNQKQLHFIKFQHAELFI